MAEILHPLLTVRELRIAMENKNHAKSNTQQSKANGFSFSRLCMHSPRECGRNTPASEPRIVAELCAMALTRHARNSPARFGTRQFG